MWLLKVQVFCTLAGLVNSQANVQPRDTRSNYMITLPPVWQYLDIYISNMGPVWQALPKEKKTKKIVKFLRDTTGEAQDKLIESLEELGIDPNDITKFWLSNVIKVANMKDSLANTIRQYTNVIKVAKEAKLKTSPSSKHHTRNYTIPFVNRDDIQPNVLKVGAKTLWDNGYNGDGILVGIIDGGVRVSHKCLTDNYDGNNGNNAAWYDATPEHSPTPVDYDGHGTHCIGTAVGTCGIGIAPGAKFIACRGLLEDGGGAEGDIRKCLEFMSCPKSDMSNDNEECGLQPDIVTCSWGAKGNFAGFNDLVKAWDEMGILGVFALGNEGPDCDTANSPGMQPDFFSVGASDNNDKVTDFSSRGPGADGIIVPTVVAPGEAIKSASNNSDTGFLTLDGTSMATPLVAGAAALLKSYDYSLSPNDLKQLIIDNVVKSVTYDGDICGGDSDQNDVYGYGRLDVAAAYESLIARRAKANIRQT